MGQTVLQPAKNGDQTNETAVREEDSGDTLPRDEIFHILQNQRRRYALHYFKQHDEAVTIGEIADQVTAWEHGITPDEITSRQRKRIYNSLQQTHLPKLAHTGFVEYDSARGSAKLTERASQLDMYLEVVPGRELPWAQYYLGLGVVSVSLMAAVWLEAFPFNLLPAAVWGSFVASVFLLSGIAHVYALRSSRLGADNEPPDVHL